MSIASAAPPPIDCANSSLSLSENLVRTECKKIESIIIEAYQSTDSKSSYVTEFDKRTIVIARGENLDIKNISDIHQNFLRQNKLITPPFSDQIDKIESQKKSIHNNWKISMRILTYSNQNRESPGYAIKCATAKRSIKKTHTIFSECFPFEEENRFIQTLDLVN